MRRQQDRRNVRSHPPHLIQPVTSEAGSSGRNPFDHLVDPFCCQRAIPLSFLHILPMLPLEQTFIPLKNDPRPANAIITSFLAAASALSVRFNETDFSMQSFPAIIRVSKHSSLSQEAASKNPLQYRYYALTGLRNRKFEVNKKEPMFDGRWETMDEWDAENCIRPEGSGIEIGNGETWERLVGEDVLWCENHACFWRIEAWAQI